MSDILRFHKSNPVRIVRTAFSGRNPKDPDDLLFYQFAKPYIRSYCQPFEQSDTIYVQYDSSFDVNILELVRCRTNEVEIQDETADTITYEDDDVLLSEDGSQFTYEGAENSATEVINIESGFNKLEGIFPLNIEPGKYKLIGKGYMNDGSADYEAESELIEVRESWSNSVLFKYYNNEPTDEIDFRTGVTMQFRVLGDFTKPADEYESDVIVSATNVRKKINDVESERMLFELYEKTPSWMIQKINKILGHDVVTIDGVGVVASERLPHNYDGYGVLWGQPSAVISLDSGGLINRHDSGSRVLFS